MSAQTTRSKSSSRRGSALVWISLCTSEAAGSAGLGDLQPAAALDRISSSVEVVASVLAIAITVVAIVVELAANRYTPRITQQFLRERTNRLVLGFYVLTTVTCLWLAAIPESELANPQAVVLLAMGLLTLCLLSLLPYFAFLFRFLAPHNVIARIREHAFAKSGGGPAVRAAVIRAIAELEDVARRARQQRDRGIAMAAVHALDGLMQDSISRRETLPPSWFAIDRELSRDADFIALSPVERTGIEEERLWVETKVFRQYLSLFEESLGVDRDLGNLIALKTRELALAHAADEPPLAALCVRFFNSYLRCAIRQQEMRSGYYVLHQYRQMAEDAYRMGMPGRALEIVGHMRFYGHFAFEVGQSFLLEVVASDVGQIVECAAVHAPDHLDAVLSEFLEVDRDSHTEDGEGEARLRGVRRAQIQLATFFLERSDEARARAIWEDMRSERPDRLRAVRDELESDQPERYWEFTDRGVNFSYLSPERRVYLDRFFGWFDFEAGCPPA